MISTNLSNGDPHSVQAPTTFNDSIASLCWTSSTTSPPLLACTSWDSQVAVYSGFENFSSPSQNSISQIMLDSGEYPYLCAGWIENGTNPALLLGGIDGSVCKRDLNAERTITIGKHNDAVKGIYHVESMQFIWTLSYDKKMIFWDVRSPESAWTYNLPAKPVCSDMTSDTAAIGFNNGQLLIMDWRGSSRVLQNLANHCIESPLGSASQLSSVSISKEGIIGVGSYDGRSNLSTFSKRLSGVNRLTNIVTFKAHKIDPGQNGNTSNLKILYPIHAVGLHPTDKKTYFTAGGDGDIIFWDIVTKNKISTLSCRPTPVTAAKVSPDWKFLAYGVGYDWAKGIEGHQSIKTNLHFHLMQSNEIAPI